MTRTITQQIESNIRPYENEERLRLTLDPSTLSFRDSFRGELGRRLNNGNTTELPRLRQVENIEVVDRETIINLNNKTTSERKEELLKEILENENAQENLNSIVNHSSDVVRSYINSLLIRFHNHENIPEVDFYRIGNILLYYVSNIELNGAEISQLMGSFRNVMFEYNQQQMVPSFINEIINHSNENINRLRLLNEEQLDRNVDDFYKYIEEQQQISNQERLIQSRKRMMMIGGGVLASLALSSLGMPPIGGLVGRSVNSMLDTTSFSTSNISPENQIRLRDVFDKGLNIIFKYLDKFK